MKKAFIIFCVLFFLSSSLVFAQNEGKGTIIGTFGLGGGFRTTVERVPTMSILFDLNLISKTGFTVSLTNVMSFNFAGTFSNNLMFGPGYHFMRENWYIGGALLVSPSPIDLIFGGKITGGFFFTDDIGVTGGLIYRRAAGFSWDLSMFDVFAGISIKLF